MNSYLFYTLIILILIKFYFKKDIINYLHKYENLKFIKEQYITIILLTLLTIVILIAAFNPSDTKNKFKSISDSYEKMKKPNKNQKPHQMFDVDTYPDSTLW